MAMGFEWLIVDPADIQHLMEGPMLESSTYRYILQQGIEQGIEQGMNKASNKASNIGIESNKA